MFELLWLKIHSSLLVLLVVAQISAKNYCTISSCVIPKEHVMCMYNTAGPAKSCQKYLEIRKFDTEQKNTILIQLNEIRNSVAIGGWEDLAGLPTASNIQELMWDNTLETFAQRLADQCATAELPDHCRNTGPHDDVGQFVSITNDTAYETHINQMVLKSAEEALKSKDKNRYYMKHAEAIPSEMQLFAQVLWATSNRIACARAAYKPTGQRTEQSDTDAVGRIAFYVCNFGSGRTRKGQVYRAGKPCEVCQCSDQYEALCASEGLAENLWLLFITAVLTVLLKRI